MTDQEKELLTQIPEDIRGPIGQLIESVVNRRVTEQMTKINSEIQEMKEMISSLNKPKSTIPSARPGTAVPKTSAPKMTASASRAGLGAKPKVTAPATKVPKLNVSNTGSFISSGSAKGSKTERTAEAKPTGLKKPAVQAKIQAVNALKRDSDSPSKIPGLKKPSDVKKPDGATT